MATNRPSAGRRPPRDDRRRNPLASLWGDRERRRALLLSALVHAGVLLGAVWVYVSPPKPEPQLLVLELTPPASGAPETAAAATGDPAPQAAAPQVAGNAPQDAASQAAAPPAPPEPVPPADLAEVLPPAEQAPPARAPSQPAVSVRLPVQPPATTLPEIEAPQVAPQPPQRALELPTPNPQADVTPARRVAVTPQVQVPPSEPLPTPDVTAELAQQDITLPQAEATVTAENPIPQPEVTTEFAQRDVTLPQAEATVAAESPIPQPDVTTEFAQREVTLPQAQADVTPASAVPQPDVAVEYAARDVPQPQASTAVSAAEALPQPNVTAEIASRPVPEPQAGAVVAQAQAVPQPSVSGVVTPSEPVPEPQAQALVAEAQPLAITPGVVISDAAPVVTPNATATVTATASAQAQESSQAGAADAGNGAQNTQAEAAQAATGQGAASDGGGAAPSGVANVQSFEVTLEQPLAVLIDNADAAYPQQGLVEASSVYEMPVEGGLTRLMSVYTRNDPAQVGPIRSARDYFLEAALAMNGTLVHVGGAPSAMNRIASQNLATVDALQDGALFAQAPDRAAPHSTFSTGTTLRDAVGRIQNNVSGTLYTPPGDVPDASSVTVNYSADYTSGFRYLPDLDQYRWLRSGTDATDAAGEAVTADAVVVAKVVAFPYPDDPEGRLYLPYSGGEATLYLRGKAIPGSWTKEGGFTFAGSNGVKVDLTPFKSWILFAPEEAQVAVQ